MAQAKIRPIETYLTIVHTNTGEKGNGKKTYSPPERLAEKTSSYRARSFEMSRTEPSGFKGS